MAQPMEGSIEEQRQQTRELWQSRPWALLHKCTQLQPQSLQPAHQLAREWCQKFADQLDSQKDTLQIQEALPETNVQKFTGGLL